MNFHKTTSIWFGILLFAICFPIENHNIALQAQSEFPNFRAETIDSKVVIGYGVAIGDVDGDGKPDILLADKKEFAWYQNPSWTRHLIAQNLTEKDNVCIAARDINGDGKVEIAVGGQWNPNDTENSGSVHYLIAQDDRTKLWTAMKLKNEPVVHRMRWVQTAPARFALVVAPLHGRGNKGGEGTGVRLEAYLPSNDHQNNEWTKTILDEEMHVTHNFDVGKWNDGDEFESVFYLGKEGAKLIQPNGETWTRQILKSVQGGGEIRFGSIDGNRFLATIEPFHGTHLAFYTAPDREKPIAFDNRVVLDGNFKQGHALAVGDLLGNGKQQIVAGWRKPNKDREMGIKLYYKAEKTESGWNSFFIDKGEMACEDLRIADLNGDGRLDIVASGRSTHNLKIYWNERSAE